MQLRQPHRIQNTRGRKVRLLLYPCKVTKSLAPSLPACDYSEKCDIYYSLCFLIFNSIILSGVPSMHPREAIFEHIPLKPIKLVLLFFLSPS